MELRTISKQKPEYSLPLYYETVKEGDLLLEKGYATHFRLLYFEKGTARITYVKNKVTLVAPSCMCVNEKEKPAITVDTSSIVHILYFQPSVMNSAFDFTTIRTRTASLPQSARLDLYWLYPFLERSNMYDGHILLGPITGKRILELLYNVNNELAIQQDDFWPCRSRSYLLELLNIVVKVYRTPALFEHIDFDMLDSEIGNVLHYLHAHYHQKITISSLTKFFHTNRTTLSKEFLKYTGLSIISYLAKIRIQMACVMLRDTSLPVQDILYRVGFEDSTHFGRMFRRYVGCTPSQYRERFHGV